MSNLNNEGWCEQMQEENRQPIYSVIAQYGHSPHFLGVVTGDIEDIRAYFEKYKGYSLEVTPLQIIRVEKGTAEKRKRLLLRERELQAELAQIRQELKK